MLDNPAHLLVSLDSIHGGIDVQERRMLEQVMSAGCTVKKFRSSHFSRSNGHDNVRSLMVLCIDHIFDRSYTGKKKMRKLIVNLISRIRAKITR